jgi:hypothetical protein
MFPAKPHAFLPFNVLLHTRASLFFRCFAGSPERDSIGARRKHRRFARNGSLEPARRILGASSLAFSGIYSLEAAGHGDRRGLVACSLGLERILRRKRLSNRRKVKRI